MKQSRLVDMFQGNADIIEPCALKFHVLSIALIMTWAVQAIFMTTCQRRGVSSDSNLRNFSDKRESEEMFKKKKIPYLLIAILGWLSIESSSPFRAEGTRFQPAER